jgi:hypothetical protein
VAANALTRLGSDALSGITGALGTTAGAAGAGALVATLLGQDFGGGTGNQNQGLDMSQVGLINPRTTDFGIGPTNFVGYEDYGTSDGDYTPNAELLKNLNAPGYNPVNEGDYGYEEVAAEEAEQLQKWPLVACLRWLPLWPRTTPSVSLRTSWRIWECVSNPQ